MNYLNKIAALGTCCPHGKQKSLCKECGGNGICHHGKQRYICKACGGNGICHHGRQKSQCIDCGGKNICAHNRVRAWCRDCRGIGICVHKLQKHQCQVCNPFTCDYCQEVYVRGTIMRHYRSAKHKDAYITAYFEAHDANPTKFPFSQLVH